MLALYAHFGAKIPEKLVGDFAFALWDEQKGYYFCARDPMGYAEFYYTFHEGRFLSASSLGDLFLNFPEKPDPNLQSMREFLCCEVNPEQTMYEGIYRLPPGHSMIVRGTRAEVSRYWHPETIKINHNMTLESAKKRFRELLTDAVMCRMDQKGTIGCELSGGLDSSSVYCIAKEQNTDITAYSMRFKGVDCDEGQYINDVLTHTDGAGVEVAVDRQDYCNEYSLPFYYEKAPYWPSRYYSMGTFLILEKMQRDGIRVALTGQGGDQVLTGSEMMVFDLLFYGKIHTFFKEFNALGSARGHVMINLLKRLIRPIVRPDIFRKALSMFLGKIKCLMECNVGCLPTRRYSKSFSQDALLRTVLDPSYSRFNDGNLCRISKDWYGVSFYHPFYDVKLIEFLLSVPPNYHYSMKWYKYLLRASLQEMLPRSILNRWDKAEFSPMLKKQIDAIDKESFWKDANIVRLGLVKECMIDHAYKKYASLGHVGIDKYWRLLNLEQWYRSNYADKAI